MPVPKLLPSQEYLQQCLNYDPVNGVLLWRHRPLTHFRNRSMWSGWNTRYAGKHAGGYEHKGDGYYAHVVGLNTVSYLASRLVYKIMLNEEPFEVDHEDTDPLNLCWANLRAADRGKNGKNRNIQKNNKSGFKGVMRRGDLPNKPYYSCIMSNGKKTHLGYFTTAEEAHAAYCEAARRLHGEFHRA